MKLESPRQIIEAYSNVNFDEIASSESRGRTNGWMYAQTYRQMNRHYEANSHFPQFLRKRLKTTSDLFDRAKF